MTAARKKLFRVDAPKARKGKYPIIKLMCIKMVKDAVADVKAGRLVVKPLK